MAWNGKRGGGWTVYSSFAKAKSRKPNKAEPAADKLLPPWALRGYMGGRTQMVSVCGYCKHLEACKISKNVKADTNYCQYNPGKFEGVDEI